MITTEEALRTVIMVAIGDLRKTGIPAYDLYPTSRETIADTLEQALRDNEPGDADDDFREGRIGMDEWYRRRTPLA